MAALVDAREFGALARELRRADKAVRDQVKADARAEIADPLARRISAAATGEWATQLRAGTKTRAGVEPTIVVGGVRPKMRGGGGPRHVVFGTEWGGGKRIARVLAYERGGRRKGRVSGHRRYATNQFKGKAHPFIFPTVARNYPAIEDAYASIVLRALDALMRRAA